MKKQIFAIILFTLISSTMIGCKPADVINLKRAELIDQPSAVEYLLKYGYMESYNNSFIRNTDALRLSLMRFQQFMSIPVTGKIDQITSEFMLRPRCGMIDQIHEDLSKLQLNAFLTTSGKRKLLLSQQNVFDNTKQVTFTWQLERFKESSMLPTLGRYLIEYGINLWAAVTNVRFQYVNPAVRADIVMSFHKGMHGHPESFDGKLGILAHASPQMKQIHFDDIEQWSYNQVHAAYFLRPGADPDLVQCAGHEMGHILGFLHSSNSKSIMYPSVLSGVRGAEYSLNAEDINQVKNKYGKCWSDRFDAIFSNFRGDQQTYIIVGPYIYKFHGKVVTVDPNSWPRANYHFWGGGFELYDDIFHGENDRLYYFWNKWYHYDINNGLSPKPDVIQKSPSTGIAGWPGLDIDNIDAAFKHNDGRVYIFKDDLVYRWDFQAPSIGNYPPGQVESGWPKTVAGIFPGVPTPVDSVFRWNYDGNVYFFKDKYFYIWNAATNRAMGIYTTDQWQNVCDVIKCTMAAKCRSWDINTNNCGDLCNL